MTKRKANIFTVIEYVPNWFAARDLVEASGQELGQSTPYVPGPSSEALIPAQEARLPSAEVCDNWPETESPTWPATASTDTLADGTEAHGYDADRSDPTPYPRVVTGGPNGAANRAELPRVNFGPTEVAKPVTADAIDDLDPTTIDDTVDSEGSTQNAFWELLKTDGYEVW